MKTIESDRGVYMASKIWLSVFGILFLIMPTGILTGALEGPSGTNSIIIFLLSTSLGVFCFALIFYSNNRYFKASISERGILLFRNGNLHQELTWDEVDKALFIRTWIGRLIKLQLTNGTSKLIFPDSSSFSNLFQPNFRPDNSEMWQLVNKRVNNDI